MATRSGSIDTMAAHVLKNGLQWDDAAIEDYLNNHSGLLGLSGSSSDIRILLEKEQQDDYRAGLALRVYVYQVQQAVGRMAASMNGIDALAFAGTVGERSSVIRQRILARLHFLDFELDAAANTAHTLAEKPVRINTHRQKPIYIVPAQEEATMLAHARRII